MQMHVVKPIIVGLALMAGLWFFGIAAHGGRCVFGGTAEAGDCAPITGWV
ncbi:MAG: hypothetical protein ABL866_08280 [Devosia sp.]